MKGCLQLSAKNCVLIAVAALALCGCASAAIQQDGSQTKQFLQTNDPSAKVVEIRDKFAPDEVMLVSTALTVKDNTLFDPGFKLLEAQYCFSSSSRHYTFRWVYGGARWVFYDEMILLLNGVPYTLKSAIEPTREVIDGNLVRETVLFNVPIDIFEKILAQGYVEVRVSGQTNYDFKLQGNDMKYFRALKEKAAEKDHLYGS